MATPNLALTHYEAGTTDPDPIVNGLADGLDHAMNSSLTINFASDADLTLTTSGSVPQQWQYGTLIFTDTSSALTTGHDVIVPTNKRIYRIVNNTAQALTVKTSAGTGIAVPASGKKFLQCDGTNVIDVTPAGSSTDNDAFHDNAAGEIAALTTVTVASGDYLLIEDVSDSNNKKKVLASDLLGSSDADAIHDNVAGEIAALTTVTVASGDYILVEDVSDSNNKKKILASDLLGGGTDAAAIHDDTAAEISVLTNVDAAPSDHLLIEDDSDSDNKKSTTVQQLRKSTTYSLTGTALSDSSGDMAYKTFSANTTITDSLTEGEGLLVEFSSGASYTITWPTMEWASGSAPTLTTKDLIVFFKLNSTLYGVHLGSPA